VIAWYRHHRGRLEEGALNDPVIRARLKELEEKRHSYGKALVILLVLGSMYLSVINHARADETQVVSPPIVTLVSQNITNDELFYIGGKVDIVDSDVIIYLQNLDTSATFSITAHPDKSGAWFYSHNSFL